LIEEAFASVKKTRLLEPAVVYGYDTVSSMNGSQISLEGDKAIRGPLIQASFPEAKELAVLLCVVDPRLKSVPAAISKKPATVK